MKKIVYAMVALATLLNVSCSTDDNENGGTSSADYLPTATGDYWVYSTALDGTATGRDSLYVAGDTTITSIAYKKFKTRDAATGFFSASLSGNGVRKSGTKLLVTGSTSVALSSELPIELAVTDFAFFDETAAAGTQIGSTTGTFEQTTTDGYTIVANYTLKSVSMGDMASYTTPANTTFTDVKAIKMTLTLKVVANFDLGNGLVIPFTVLDTQDVLNSTQYYAKNVGNVHTATTITYNLADLSSLGITLPIDQTGTYNQEEVLQTYQVE